MKMLHKIVEKEIPKFYIFLIPAYGWAFGLLGIALMARELFAIQTIATIVISIVVYAKIGTGLNSIKSKERMLVTVGTMFGSAKLNLTNEMMLKSLDEEFDKAEKKEKSLIRYVLDFLYPFPLTLLSIYIFGIFQGETRFHIVLYALLVIVLTFEFFRGFQAKAQFRFLEVNMIDVRDHLLAKEKGKDKNE